MEAMAKEVKEVDKFVTWFTESESATRESRLRSERDADYYHGIQLTSSELSTLKSRKQPPVINNRIKPKVDYLLGLERQSRTDPRALPRTPVHEDAAAAATDGLRYVCDSNIFPQIRSEAFENGLIQGTYGAQIIAKRSKKGDMDIKIIQIPWDRIFYDHHSRKRDFSDALYKGIVVWQDKDQAELLYPGKEQVLTDTFASASSNDTYGDTPKLIWIDGKRNRVRCIQIEYMHKGEWWSCHFTQGGFLVDPAPSTYLDDVGEPSDTIELQSSFVDRDGNRYGLVRQYIDMQDEINKRRSKGLHLLNTRQVVAEKGAVNDVQKARNELAKPDGYVEINPGMEFKIQPTNDMAAGNFQMLQEAKNEIDAQGPNAALSGAEPRDLSGRAIQSLQQGSNTELGPLLDCLRAWQHRVYCHIWNRIRQYWTEEKWVRVTDDENNLKYVGLNKKITMGEQLIKQLQAQGQEVSQEEIQQIMSDPRAQQIAVENAVADLDIDIILDEAPDTVSIQQEQFTEIARIYPSVPPQLQPLAFEMLIEASSLRNKKKFLQQMKGGGDDPAAQEQQKQAQQQQQTLFDLKAKEQEAKIGTLNAKATLNMAQAHNAISPAPDTPQEMAMADPEGDYLAKQEQIAKIQKLHAAALKDRAAAHSTLNPPENNM